MVRGTVTQITFPTIWLLRSVSSSSLLLITFHTSHTPAHYCLHDSYVQTTCLPCHAMRFSTSLIAAVSATLLGVNSAHGYGILGRTPPLLPSLANCVCVSLLMKTFAVFSCVCLQPVGHTFTGQVAQIYLTPETARQVKEILSPYYDGLLSKVAPWADTIKGQARYR